MAESDKRFIRILGGAFLSAVIIFGAILSLALLGSCNQEPPQTPKSNDGWIKIGDVADSNGGCTVWRKKDDNGKIVYVAIGVNACSVTAVDEKKP